MQILLSKCVSTDAHTYTYVLNLTQATSDAQKSDSFYN